MSLEQWRTVLSLLGAVQRQTVGKSSLHQRIRAEIEQRILSGEWEPGYRIPFEHELMVHYGCARMTVSKVLSGLADAGLIERRRRAGSFVRRPVGQSAILDIPDIKAEILGRNKIYTFECLVRKLRPVSREDLHLAGAELKGRVLALIGRHCADSEPFAVEERLISLDAVPEAAEASFLDEPPGTWLLHHVPWQEAEHCIKASGAEPKIAQLLGVTSGAPCLVVERRTWQAGAILTAVRFWYRGDRQKFVARFTPSGIAPRSV